METSEARHESKTRLLNAALRVIRTRGYAATRVEDVCEAAGLTKGSFFHHFKSKEDLALGAARHWSEVTGALFARASYHDRPTALERVLAYIDFRKELLRGDIPEYTCLVGTMVQEVFETNPALREACAESICGHASTLEADISQAMRDRGVSGSWTAASLALHTQAVLQGAFILAKATGNVSAAADSVEHLHRYIELLFTCPLSKE